MANDWTKKDGWKTKGVKQLTRLNVQRACHLAEALEAQDVDYNITIRCKNDYEFVTAKEAWAGLKSMPGNQMNYKNVLITRDE